MGSHYNSAWMQLYQLKGCPHCIPEHLKAFWFQSPLNHSAFSNAAWRRDTSTRRWRCIPLKRRNYSSVKLWRNLRFHGKCNNFSAVPQQLYLHRRTAFHFYPFFMVFVTVNKIYVPWTMKNNHIWCTSAPDFRNHHCLSNSRPGNSRHLHRIGLWPSARKHRCQFSRFATTRTFNEVPSNWHPGSLG